MVEYALELMDRENVLNCIEYILNAQADNGWIPDRVDENGIPYYTAGDDSFPAQPNLDNGPFIVIAAVSFLNSLPKEKAKTLLSKWENALYMGIDCLPTDKNGMIYNSGNPPHSPYGFTDTVCKTGSLAMESLLLWKSMRMLSEILDNSSEKVIYYKEKIHLIEKNFEKIFSDYNGMIFAATGTCRQTDIWASCYAVSEGFPLSEKSKENIRIWLARNYGTITEHGQIRHLPYGQYWQKTFIPVKKNTYQNGAFWATATGWFCETINRSFPELAKKIVSDVLNYFKNSGIYECVCGDYRKLDTYVVSATNIYGYIKKHYNLTDSEIHPF